MTKEEGRECARLSGMSPEELIAEFERIVSQSGDATLIKRVLMGRMAYYTAESNARKAILAVNKDAQEVLQMTRSMMRSGKGVGT